MESEMTDKTAKLAMKPPHLRQARAVLVLPGLAEAEQAAAVPCSTGATGADSTRVRPPGRCSLRYPPANRYPVLQHRWNARVGEAETLEMG